MAGRELVELIPDGSLRDVVHEVLKLAGYTVYDGNAYGDNDGLLSDESLPVTKAEMGKIARQCGFT